MCYPSINLLNKERNPMKVKELMEVLKGCNPDADVIIEDAKTKEVFKSSYCEYDFFSPKATNERKKVFIGTIFKEVK